MKDLGRTLKSLEIVGGSLCLDFANTVNSRADMEHDYLMQYSDLVGWADKIGILSPTQTSQLQKMAEQNAEEAQVALDEARRMREILYRVFSRIADSTEPPKKDMELLLTTYGESISHGQLIKKDHRYTTTWKPDESLKAILWPIVHSAGELLVSDDLEHVKECPGCGWLFLDTSKNQSRRWCSMNTCGARDKMRRYHKRKQAK